MGKCKAAVNHFHSLPNQASSRGKCVCYLPLLYVLGAQDKADGVSFFAEKVTLGSMSMRSVRLG